MYRGLVEGAHYVYIPSMVKLRDVHIPCMV